LFAAIILVGLTTIGNGYIRGNLTCKYCKQREIGCPAEQLFSKK
jgi:F0F1-type ATP synthase membrane subunit c/vacuolar-type H+-ATPase subunit K